MDLLEDAVDVDVESLVSSLLGGGFLGSASGSFGGGCLTGGDLGHFDFLVFSY